MRARTWRPAPNPAPVRRAPTLARRGERTRRRAALSSLPSARLARAEEFDERLDDATIRMDGDLVDGEATQQPTAAGDLLLHGLAEATPHVRVARVDVERVARLGIDEPREPDVGERPFARVVHRYGDDVVPLREQLERM